jgi:cytosine deaminase
MVTSAAARVLGLADYGLHVGSQADFVVVAAGSIAEAIASRPRRKLVVKAGRVVARDGMLET